VFFGSREDNLRLVLDSWERIKAGEGGTTLRLLRTQRPSAGEARRVFLVRADRTVGRVEGRAVASARETDWLCLVIEGASRFVSAYPELADGDCRGR
jgi:hypothetical protein